SPKTMTARVLAAATSASGVKSTPLARPPANNTTGAGTPPSDASSAPRLVPLESLIHSTPPMLATDWHRCGRPEKLHRPVRMLAAGNPAAADSVQTVRAVR